MVSYLELLRLTEVHARVLQELEALLARRAKRAYAAAASKVVTFLYAAARANPDADFHSILSRSFSQVRINTILREAYDTSQLVVRTAAETGWRMGSQHAVDELGLLGADLERLPFPLDTPYLDSLMDDLERAFSDSLSAFYGSSDKESLRHALDVISNRVSATSSVAANRSYSDAQMAHYREAQAGGLVLEKVWITSVGNSCPVCAALDGTVVSLEYEFDRNAVIGDRRPPDVYRDLMSPPRHPNCRCRLMAVTSDMATSLRRG